MEWMDTLRGLAILLVVAFHATGMPTWNYGIEMPKVLVWFNDFAAPFRMPALLVLSGMLLPRALTKPPAAYVSGKLRTLVWPFMIWAVIEGLASDWLTNGAGYALWVPHEWIGMTHLWFIGYLGVYFFAAPIVRWVPSWAVILACWALSLVVAGWSPDIFYYAGFFFAGHAAIEHRALLDRWLTPAVGSLLGILGVAVGLMSLGDRDSVTGALFVPFILGGIHVAIRAAQRLPAGALRWMQFMGRHSVVFYLVHVPVLYAVCRLTVPSGVLVSPWLLFGLQVAAALLVGWGLVVLRREPVVGLLFEGPRAPTDALVAWIVRLGSTLRPAHQRTQDLRQ